MFRLGMLPELVLNQEEKKERFRKSIAKKKNKSDMEEVADADEVEPEASSDNSEQDHLMDRMPAAAAPPRIESLLSPICY